VTGRGWDGELARVGARTSATAVWSHAGRPPRPMRWGLVRDPQGQVEPQAWRCPDRTVEPGPSLQGFVWRWRLDITGPEARVQLGRETPRPWNARAMARTTPALLGRFSLMPLWTGPWPQAHTRPVR
jgi:hypothetical protein